LLWLRRLAPRGTSRMMLEIGLGVLSRLAAA
jgi:hypothetical protein